MKTLISRIITDPEEIFKILEFVIEKKEGRLITYVNQHCFNVYVSDEVYRDILLNNFIIYYDGIGMYYVLKYLFGRNPKKFNASDINYAIINYLLKNKIKMFLIGGNFLSEQLLQLEKSIYFGYHNGYFNDSQINEIANQIAAFNAEVIVVGMGVPRQEMVAIQLSKMLPNKIYICVGNFLEFYFGNQKRMPQILRNTGIEWIYRIILEPRRLLKRYLIGIPLFLYRVIKFKFQK